MEPKVPLSTDVVPPDAGAWRAEVLVAAPVGVLDYGVAAPLAVGLAAGMGVVVPLGKRQVVGYVLALHPPDAAAVPSERPLREVAEHDPADGQLPLPLLQLLTFAARYYRVTPGEMLIAALPRAARDSAQRYFATVQQTAAPAEPPPKAAPAAALQLAQEQPRGFTVVALERRLGCRRATALRHLRHLCDQGLLTRQLPRRARKQRVSFARQPPTAADAEALGPRQQKAAAVLALLPVDGTPMPLGELLAEAPQARRQLATLQKHGLVCRRVVEVAQDPFPEAAALAREAPPPPTLTPDQAAALKVLEAAVHAGTFAAHLLHGITGSGKTEVYLHAIAATLAAGRSALVLVPEIALTPQLGAAFRGRFGTRVATFHSGLTDAQRRDEYDRVQRGEARIGLGARSALFLPLADVGMIIVDEEHEGSFKQDESPRYHARDLAVRRAQLHGAVVVLGSATPALESHQNAQTGRYVALHLPRRVANRPLPEVQAIDLRQSPRGADGVFSAPLLAAMQRCIAAGEQALRVINRRGFAPYVFCRDCGHSYRCEACDVALTLHRGRQVLCCHYCGAQRPAPECCEACDSHRVGTQGLGTEQVQEAVRLHFPGLPALRLDRDVVRNKKQLEGLLGTFRRREAQILIGTQMVAKGHDFPAVTLVGVLAADASLNFPDFRAAERTFALITQVAGRAGRGERPGRVLAQAYETDHYALRAAMQHDYSAFAEQELQHRRELLYPPFAHLALLRVNGPHEQHAAAAAEAWGAALRAGGAKAGLSTLVLGPAPAPLARLRERFRFTLLLKATSRRDLHHSLSLCPPTPSAGIEMVVDVDPCHML